MISIISDANPKRFKAQSMAVWSSESKACFQSRNRKLRGLAVILDYSIARRRTNIGWTVLCCALNPYWVRLNLASQVCASLDCNIAAKILYVTLSSEIGR